MRTPVINVLAGLMIGAAVAVLVALSATTAVVGTAHAEPQVHVWPVDVGDGPTARFNDTAVLDPSRVIDLRSTLTCWVEKVDTATPFDPGGAEVVCGDAGDRARQGTAEIGEPFGGLPSGDCGWYASYLDGYGFTIDPMGCN